MNNPNKPSITDISGIMSNAKTDAEPKEDSKRSVSDRWLDLIFECLKNLEKYERSARNGSIDLTQYLTLRYDEGFIDQPNIETEIRIKSINLMISEFRILITNFGDIILPKEFIEKCNKVLNWANAERNYIATLEDEKKGNYYTKAEVKRYYADGSLTKEILFLITGKKFYSILNELSNLRAELVRELKDILFMLDPKTKDTGKPL